MSKSLLVGDSHGSIKFAEQFCATAKRHNVDRIIQLGDFGYMWPGKIYDSAVHDKTRWESLKGLLRKYDQKIWFLDGNHEPYNLLKSDFKVKVDAEKAIWINDRVKYLPRGYRFQIDGVKFMSFGGAISIDKDRRTPYIDWFPQEEITQEQVDRVTNEHVDILLTHDVPLGVPTIEQYAKDRNYLPDRLTRESYRNRRYLKEVFDKISPYVCCHGHWHMRYSDNLEGCKIQGLSCNGNPGSMALLETSNGSYSFTNVN